MCLWWLQILNTGIWVVRVVLKTQKCIALIWKSFMWTLWNFLIKDNWDFFKKIIENNFSNGKPENNMYEEKGEGDSWARFQQKALQCPQPKIPDCASEHTHTHTHTRDLQGLTFHSHCVIVTKSYSDSRAYSHSQAPLGEKRPQWRTMWIERLHQRLLERPALWVHLHVLTQNTSRLETHA